MELRPAAVALLLAGRGMAQFGQFGQRELQVASPALTEILVAGQGDGQIVAGEGQHARHGEIGRLVDQRAVGQAEDDRVGIVGRQELARLRRHRIGRALVAVAYEDAVQLAPAVMALFDAQRHAVAEMGELADLDRRPQRTRAQLEAQLLVIYRALGWTKPTIAMLSAARMKAYMKGTRSSRE